MNRGKRHANNTVDEEIIKDEVQGSREMGGWRMEDGVGK